MKKIKIGFIGAHCTGKTSLCFDLAGHIKKKTNYPVGLVLETARSCPFPIDNNRTITSQLWIMSKQITKEIETIKNNNFVICDRTVFDVVAYTRFLNTLDEDEAQVQATLFYSQAVNYSNIYPYDILIHVSPLDEDLIDDGFRDTDKNLQLKFNEWVLKNVPNISLSVNKYEFDKITSYVDSLELY